MPVTRCTDTQRHKLACQPVSGSQVGAPAVVLANSRRTLIWMAITVAVASVVVAVGRSAIGSASAMRSLANGGNPFWVPSHAFLLYVCVPAVVISAILVFIAPGLFLASALGATRSWSWWLLCGVSLSVVLDSAVTAAVQRIVATSLNGGRFLTILVSCSAAAALLAWRKAERSGKPAIPASAARNAVESATALAVILVILFPKFMWENFNGDGADALEVARLLLRQVMPFWPSGSGTVADFPGMTSMLFAYPASWFVRTFGAIEFSARAPLLLALLATHGGIVALAEVRERGADGAHLSLSTWERLLIWAALLVYTIVVAYSASYSVYSADIAMPGAQDTLLVALFAATIVAVVSDDVGWMLLFGLLSYLALPNGLLLLGMLCIAVVVVYRPVPWRAVIALGALTIFCIALGMLARSLLQRVGSPVPGGEYTSGHLLQRVLMVQFSDWRRVLYVLVPCGIAPLTAIFLWKRHDSLGRVIAILVAVYFVFTYLQAYSKLHYYVPAMLLPIALYWRVAPRERRQRSDWRVAALAGLAGAVILALPRRATPMTWARRIASEIQLRVAGYEISAPEEFRAADTLILLFPMPWDRRVPNMLAGSPLVWNYYLLHNLGVPSTRTNYVVQPVSMQLPAGFHSIGQQDGFTMLVRSDSLLAKDRSQRLPVNPGSPLFQFSHGMLFNYATASNGAPIHDLIGALVRRSRALRTFLNDHDHAPR